MKKGIKTVATVAFSALTGAAAGAVAVGKSVGKKTQKAQGYADKHLALFQMMNQWVRVKCCFSSLKLEEFSCASEEKIEYNVDIHKYDDDCHNGEYRYGLFSFENR